MKPSNFESAYHLAFMMTCLIRHGYNAGCIKQRKWMPVILKSQNRSYTSIRKGTKRKIKKNEISAAISAVENTDETEQVKHCNKYNSINGEGGNIKEFGNGIPNEISTTEEIRKPAYPLLSDFVIRNIMSFPICGPFNDTEKDYESECSNFSSYPSVTTILNETSPIESKRLLEKWKQNMIAQMGFEKFSEMNRDPVKKAKSRRTNKKSKKILAATLLRGRKFHSTIKEYLLGNEVKKTDLGEDVEGCWNSVMTALPHITNVKLVETSVYHPHLHYKGIVDCVACFKNVPHVIEWKQSEKTKSNIADTYDAPIQLCAYMGTMPWCKTLDLAEPVSNGLVVIAYVDGSPADIFSMNSEYCQLYWEQWLRRVQQFWLVRSPELKEKL